MENLFFSICGSLYNSIRDIAINYGNSDRIDIETSEVGLSLFSDDLELCEIKVLDDKIDIIYKVRVIDGKAVKAFETTDTYDLNYNVKEVLAKVIDDIEPLIIADINEDEDIM